MFHLACQLPHFYLANECVNCTLKLYTLSFQQMDNVKLLEEVNSNVRTVSCTYTSSGMCERVVEVEEEKRRVVGELEDITFQLNNAQEELVVYQEKVNQLEVSLWLVVEVF